MIILSVQWHYLIAERMRRYQLEFADFYSTTGKEISAVENAHQQNLLFWGRSRSRYNIFHCETEEEFRRYSRPHYFHIARAIALPNGDIVVRSRSSAKLSHRRYLQVLAHELNHSFWLDFTSAAARWKPFWLFEATACLVAKNDYLLSKTQLAEYMLFVEDKFAIPYRYLTRYLSSIEQVKFHYSLWYHFLQFLLDEQAEILPGFLFKFFRNPSPVYFQVLCEDSFGDTLPNLKSFFFEAYFDDL